MSSDNKDSTNKIRDIILAHEHVYGIKKVEVLLKKLLGPHNPYCVNCKREIDLLNHVQDLRYYCSEKCRASHKEDK